MTVDMKNYRVLQVLPHLNSGGLVSGAIEISNALQKSGNFYKEQLKDVLNY